jgi:hypothetical protein
MILVRTVFRLKFGKAREAVALMKEAIEIGKQAGADVPTRILTDVVGPFYTLVLEQTFPNIGAIDQQMPAVMRTPKWQEHYQKVIPLVESGYREIFTIAE